MSFKTSPILNRIKNIKGWKQSSFPIKTSDYSRDIILGLKVYLLINAFLTLNNFTLLFWQLRNFKSSNKVLYILLIHSNNRPRKKKIFHKNFRIKFFSPLYLNSKKNSIYLFYRNFSIFKKMIYSQYNNLEKKLLPSGYLHENYTKNVNFALYTTWKNQKWNKKASSRKITNFLSAYLKAYTLIKLSKKKKRDLSKSFKNKLYYHLKKIEKEIFFFQKILKLFMNKQVLLTKNDKSFIELKIFHNFRELVIQKHIYLKKLIQVLIFFKVFSLETKKKFPIVSKLTQFNAINLAYKVKKNESLIRNPKNLINNLKNKSFFFKTLKTSVIKPQKKITSRLYPKTHNYKLKALTTSKQFFFLLRIYFQHFRFLKNEKYSINKESFAKKQNYWNYFKFLQNNMFYLNKFLFKKLNFLNFYKKKKIFLEKFETKFAQTKKNKTYAFFSSAQKYKMNSVKVYKFFRKFWFIKPKKTFVSTRFFYLFPNSFLFSKILRWNEQNLTQKLYRKKDKYQAIVKVKSKKLYQKNLKKIRKYFNKHSKNKLNLVKLNSIKKPALNPFLQYRIPFRKNNRNTNVFLIKQELKCVLQNFLQKSLNIHFKIKIINSRAEFKNLKFYKVFFTAPVKKTKVNIKFNRKKNQNTKLKTYLYLGLKTQSSSRKNFIKFLQKRYLSKKFKKLNFTQFKSNALVKSKYFLKVASKNEFNKYDTQNYTFLARDHKSKAILKRFVPILIIFMKYLNPQIIVNQIAKELEYSQVHDNVFYILKQVLIRIPLRRLIAYRVAITGRINGAQKTRTIYFTKGKIPLQTFKKKVNFSLAQARGRIGTFGVKMWSYS